MSKDTIFIDGLKPYLKFVCNEDVHESKVKIYQWGLMDVREWYYPNVCRQEWILYWNLTPGQKIEVNGRTFYPDIKKVYLFSPYTKFGGRGEKDFIQFYMHFRASAPFDSVKTELVTFDSAVICENMQKAVKTSNPELQSLYLTQIVLAALTHVPKKMFRNSPENISDSRIRLALEKINKNPSGSNSVEELASSVKMSVNNFHRKFRDCTFQTPKQYVLQKRLEFARELMMNSSLSMDEIAEKSGFANRYHFSKAFKNYYSYPPVAYRKMKMSKNKRR